MGVHSKLLPYTCYELGHCWTHCCSAASFEMCLIGFTESLQIYGVVYLLTALVNARKMSLKYAKKTLKDYLNSVCFLTINAFGYIGSFCIIRHLLGHVNFISASFLPGFTGSLAAILAERPERRTMLAIYVANVASECIWNSLVGHGYVKSIPRGEVLIFAASMTVLGYFFRSQKPASHLIQSILQMILGSGESGAMMREREAAAAANCLPTIPPPPQSWVKRLLSPLTARHHLCPHPAGCLPHFLAVTVKGFVQGFVVQLGLNVLPKLPSIIRQPYNLLPLLFHRNNTRAGIFFSWFSAVFKGVCCGSRWWCGRENAVQGAVAGALAGVSMYWYPAHSIALYIMWKVLETLYSKGCKEGYLPRIPGSMELLYALATGYLFHIAVIEKHHMKPSYWRFLERLTWKRLNGYNRHLLSGYGYHSATDFINDWPDYDFTRVSDDIRRLTAEHHARMEL